MTLVGGVVRFCIDTGFTKSPAGDQLRIPPGDPAPGARAMPAEAFTTIAGWIPPYAPDAAELLLVLITLLISMGIMVAFGAWWSR